MGLDDEPLGSLGAEVEIKDYALLQSLNAVVYASGYWKITEWDRGEKDLLAGGREDRQSLAIQRATEVLLEMFERGLQKDNKEIA